MSINYDQKTQEAQQKLQQAQQDAARRQYEQEAPQRAIAEAQRELVGIEQQKQRDELAHRQAVNYQAVQRTLELNSAVTAVLESGDVRKAIGLIAEAEAAWLSHRSALFSVLQMMVDGYFNEREIGWYGQRFHIPQAWGWSYAVNEWIGQAPDPLTSRIRSGLAYAAGHGINGQVITASKNYSASNAYTTAQRAAYRA